MQAEHVKTSWEYLRVASRRLQGISHFAPSINIG